MRDVSRHTFAAKGLDADRDSDVKNDDSMSQIVPECPTEKGALATQVEARPVLPPAARRALGALLEGKTCSQAAELAGVDRRTLYRWRQDPAFAAELERASRGMLEATAARVRAVLLTSSEKLPRLLKGYEGREWAFDFLKSGALWRIAQLVPREETSRDAASTR